MGVIRCLWYLNWARGKTFSTGRAGERERKKKGGSVEEREKYGRHIKALTELSLRVMNVQ